MIGGVSELTKNNHIHGIVICEIWVSYDVIKWKKIGAIK